MGISSNVLLLVVGSLLGTQRRVLKHTSMTTKVGRTETDIFEKFDKQKLASAKKQAHSFFL